MNLKSPIVGSIPKEMSAADQHASPKLGEKYYWYIAQSDCLVFQYIRTFSKFTLSIDK